jgi:hypothetical protein
MVKSIYVCGMEKKKQMLVDVDVINDTIKKLKELQERQQLDVDLDWRSPTSEIHTLEDYLGFAEDYYSTSYLLRELMKLKNSNGKE